MIGRTRFSIPKTTWAYTAILGVLVVGAIMREINLLIILAGMMCGPLLISWQMVRTNLKQLKITRRLPSGVNWGSPFDVELRVQNGRKHIDSWAIVMDDRIRNLTVPAARAQRGMCFVPHVPTGETRTATYPVQLWQRGRYQFGPLRVSTRVPVGLLKGKAIEQDVDEMLVYPRLGYLLRGWKDLVRYDQQGQRSAVRRQGQTEGNFYGLRGWRVGDCRRWIHWRSSAKRNALVVRQFEQQRNQNLVVLLDLTHVTAQRNLAPGVGNDFAANAEESAVELAVSLTATVVVEHCRKGSGQLTLRVVGQRDQELRGDEIRGPAGAAISSDALDLLSEVMPFQVTPSDVRRTSELTPPESTPSESTPSESTPSESTPSDGAGEERRPYDLLGPLPSLNRDDHVLIVRPGPVDPSRWCAADGHDRVKVAGAILINTAQSSVRQLFSWEDPVRIKPTAAVSHSAHRVTGSVSRTHRYGETEESR